MKRIIYSGFVKFVALVLFVASIVMAVLSGYIGIMEYSNETVNVYYFENSFEESSYISSLIEYPEDKVMSIYWDLFYEYDAHGHRVELTDGLKIDPEEIEQELQKRLSNHYYSSKIDYYIQWDDVVVTNCGATSPEALMNGEFYSYVKHEGLGYTEREGFYGNSRMLTYSIEYMTGEQTVIVSCKVKDEVASEYRAIWENQKDIVVGTITKMLSCIFSALLMLIYLICVCGKNRYGETKTIWIDNIWTEVHLISMAFFAIGAVFIYLLIFEECDWKKLPYSLLLTAIGATAGLASTAIITSLLSIIRNIKCKRFIESSIIFRITRWCLRLIIKVCKFLLNVLKAFANTIFKLLSKKTGVLLITSLLAYTILIGFFGVYLPYSPIWLVLGILLFLFASYFIAQRVRDIDEIKKGAHELCGGNITYNIQDLKSEDMKALAEDINDIARGLDESVAAKVKAERMKTELITNVSHDLKTPITSIISYTELLSKMEDLPEEARDYVAVISKKSSRLKTLTEDLFDISKVQSGNETVIMEKLDASLLINQSVAEHNREIADSGLTFIYDLQKDTYIFADGRKLSRVIGNLINNILKYTMKNTRVFITVAEMNEVVVMEFKNIASYPMNFSADEIAGRFVRGDESRTADGNGLGLAIAKSYTELCGGQFEIVVDGDMFKINLRFKKIG